MNTDFQCNNKLAEKQSLANAKMCDEVVDEQHGQRKNRKAILCCLNKMLVADYLCFTTVLVVLG